MRFMNLSAMDHHPMHLHDQTFWITGTEGGRIPESAWIPSNNVIVGVGQSRDVEFIANNPGDWMIHCHIPHHMMNNMVSMVGPMPGMAGNDSAGHGVNAIPETTGGEFASGALGAGLEPSLGPATSSSRAVITGMRPSDTPMKFKVPGYPQEKFLAIRKTWMEIHGMMSAEDMRKVNTPLTRGLRRDWPMSSQAMMTILRVLPDELYEKVVSGKGHIEPGASSPGAGPGQAMDHSGHEMSGSETTSNDGAKQMDHSRHQMPAENTRPEPANREQDSDAHSGHEQH